MFFGLKSFCLGLIVNSWIDLYCSTYYTKKLLGFGLARQLKSVIPYLLISLVVLAEALLITHYFQHNLISLALSLVVCGATYLSLTRVMHLYAFNEALELVRGRMHKQ